MPLVKIPPEHFTKNVKKNYQNHKIALIREFLQNSVDASSICIEFIFDKDDRSLTVKDDGCGMSKEILVDALLTMSGTHKGPNSIGGFGAAKEILLFQHTSYDIITTQNNITTAVHGEQLEYDFYDTVIDHDGTIIKIKFTDDYELDNFENIAISYLHKCTVKPIITWNNEEIKPHDIGNIIRSFDWANIYSKECTEEQNYLYIRVNGVLMCTQYVDATKYLVSVEILKPSTEILTVNRDSFTYKYADKVSKLVHEVSMEKSSFGLMYNKTYVWEGEKRHFTNEIKYELNASNISVNDTDDMVKQAIQFVTDNTKSSYNRFISRDAAEFYIEDAVDRFIAPNVFDKQVVDKIRKSFVDHMISGYVDFYVTVDSKTCNKIPANIEPSTMDKKHLSIIKLWKKCIDIVLRANDIYLSYAIGWCVSDSNDFAMWRRDNGLDIFFLNSNVDWAKTSIHSNVFNKLLIAACHEVTHVEFQYHDEYFISRSERYIENCLIYLSKTGNSWWKEYTASKNEII